MQTAFHEALGAAFAHQAHRLGGRRVAVRRVDDLECGDLQATLLGERLDAGRRSHQNRSDDAELRRIYGAGQRRLVAWMHDRRGDRRQRLGARQQAFVFLMLARHCKVPGPA
jgi:hypothetical protein